MSANGENKTSTLDKVYISCLGMIGDEAIAKDSDYVIFVPWVPPSIRKEASFKLFFKTETLTEALTKFTFETFQLIPSHCTIGAFSTNFFINIYLQSVS